MTKGEPMQRVHQGQRWSERVVSQSRDATRISAPLSDKDILIFEEKLLNSGFQFLRVPTMQLGRNWISTFLDTLLLYHEVGCLSADAIEDDKNIIDMYEQLTDCGYLSTLNNARLEDFFMNHFYYDFIWIELDEIMVAKAWFNTFIEGLELHGISHRIPVLIVSSDI